MGDEMEFRRLTGPDLAMVNEWVRCPHADGARLSRGLGTRMVRAFVARLFEDPRITRVQADPRPSNLRAIRCYERCGFVRVREIVTPDGPALLLARSR